jgi:DNA-binding GntR family transcriptional regulator
MQLADLAYARLRSMILDCELMPSSPITENGIVERLALGKTPVREAMRRLVQEGLLDVVSRLGYTVTPITLQTVDDVFQLRQIAEVAAVELAVGRLTATDIARLESLCAIGYDSSDRASIIAFLADNAEFHGVIARASGNQRLAELVTRLLDESQRFIHIGILLRPRSHEAKREHSALLREIIAGKSAVAMQQVRSQIESARVMVRDSLATSDPSSV